MTEEPARNTLERVEELDELDVPTTSLYERAGRAEPREIPSAPPVAPVPVNNAEEKTPEPSATALAEAPADAGERPGEVVDPRRGTTDIGLLALRVAVGGALLFYGIRAFFDLSGGGIPELERQFSEYSATAALAIGVPAVQLVAGAFLLLGLFSPVAAGAAVAVSGFGALHLGTGVAGLGSDSVVVAALIFGCSVAVALTGPGLLSADVGRAWSRRPRASSWASLMVGLGLAAGLWFAVTM